MDHRGDRIRLINTTLAVGSRVESVQTEACSFFSLCNTYPRQVVDHRLFLCFRSGMSHIIALLQLQCMLRCWVLSHGPRQRCDFLKLKRGPLDFGLDLLSPEHSLLHTSILRVTALEFLYHIQNGKETKTPVSRTRRHPQLSEPLKVLDKLQEAMTLRIILIIVEPTYRLSRFCAIEKLRSEKPS